MRSSYIMLKTELKLSLRGLDMFIFAICMPVVVMILLGAVFGHKEAFPGAGYSFVQQSFGAVSVIAIAAGGVMGLPLVLSSYREKKILKRFQVTPVSPLRILVIQVLIYALYAFVSLFLVYGVAVLFLDFVFLGRWPQFLAMYLLVMLAIFSMGILVGGLAPNEKMAGVYASLLYFPMLIFSGATLPYEVMPKVLQGFADLLPLTQGIMLLKASSLGLPLAEVIGPLLSISILGILCTGIAVRYFKWV